MLARADGTKVRQEAQARPCHGAITSPFDGTVLFLASRRRGHSALISAVLEGRPQILVTQFLSSHMVLTVTLPNP